MTEVKQAPPVSPEEEALIEGLATAREELKVVRKSESEAMREVHQRIRAGFGIGLSGVKLSRASGLSLPRVYQIRDEG